MNPIDSDELAARLSRCFGGAEVSELRPLSGGASSLTYTADVRSETGPARRVVVKIAPPGLAPVGNRDVLRQSKVLRVLAGGSRVAVPPMIAEDPGDPPAVPPLFVMGFLEGESVEPLHETRPPSQQNDVLISRALAAMRLLAALQATDVTQLDEQPVRLGDEIDRWARAFSTVPRFADRATRCADRLRSGMPRESPPALVHGDFRLGNMLATGTRIVGLLDWEVWTLGDPRLDLAWFLNMTDPEHPGAMDRRHLVPSRDVLVAEYSASIGSEPVDLPWFLTLVRFRQAAMSALIGKHARKATDPDPRALEIEGWVDPLLADVLAAAE